MNGFILAPFGMETLKGLIDSLGWPAGHAPKSVQMHCLDDFRWRVLLRGPRLVFDATGATPESAVRGALRAFLITECPESSHCGISLRLQRLFSN